MVLHPPPEVARERNNDATHIAERGADEREPEFAFRPSMLSPLCVPHPHSTLSLSLSRARGNTYREGNITVPLKAP